VAGHHVLGVVGAVEFLAVAVLAGAGMIAADDQVGAAVVAADDRVPDRLAGAAHAHRERQQRQRGGLLGIFVQHMLIAAHPRVVIDITGLGHAHHRVDQQIGLGLTGGEEGQFDMGPVHRVAGLKGDNAAPAIAPEALAQFGGGQAQMREIVVPRQVQRLHAATDIHRVTVLAQPVHGRVGRIAGPEHLLGLMLAIGAPDVVDGQDRQNDPLGIAQGDARTGAEGFGECLADIQRDWHGPEGAIGQAHVIDHALIVRLPHEALKR